LFTFQDESILIWYSGRKEKQLKLNIVSKIIPGQRTVSSCTFKFCIQANHYLVIFLFELIAILISSINATSTHIIFYFMPVELFQTRLQGIIGLLKHWTTD